MLVIVPADRDRDGKENSVREGPAPFAMPAVRHTYAPSAGGRIFGVIGTLAIYLLILAGFFFTITTTVNRRPEPSALTVVDLEAPALPLEMPPEEKEAPRPVEKKSTPTEPVPIKVTPTIVPLAAVTVPVPESPAKAADPALKEPETAAPKVAPVPPTPKVSTNGPDTWEGRVLAALNKQRRYPRAAQIRRQQGVPYVRFVMNREGKVLSSRLERSSGVPDLDREAVALPKRAQPLPKPPDDKTGETIELVVPVEFFMP